MTCEEFERVLPEMDDQHTVDQESHLVSCAVCSDLVADLNVITEQARYLRDIDEPNPRVWNSIEIALRQEGLIREVKTQPFLVPQRPPRRRLTWPVASAIAIALIFTLVQRQRIHKTPGTAEIASTPAVTQARPSADDQELLAVVSQRSPALLASYEANLRDVNSYIRDAEDTVKTNPNDEQAQRYLMNAYEQRAMVYDMALDRSLP